MIVLLSKIELYPSEKGRKIPFKSGYRPLFNFDNAPTKISGRIDLIERTEFRPGMSDTVRISFVEGVIDEEFFSKGITFTFDEGIRVLGKGEILEVSKI